MPSSTCASVPTKTRPRARAMRATVSLSEASASTNCMTGPRRRAGLGAGPAVAAGAGTATGGTDVWMAVLSTFTSVEFHGAHELVERRLLLANEVGRPVHLEEPGFAVARHDDAEDAPLAAAGRLARALEVHGEALGAAHLHLAGGVDELLLVQRRQAELVGPPAVDVGEQPSGRPGHPTDGDRRAG